VNNTARKALLIVLLFSLAVFGAGSFASQLKQGNITLVIIHTNDFHGNLKPIIDKRVDEKNEMGGAAYVASLINSIRSQYPGKVLLVDAGDTYQGTPVSNSFHGEPVLQMYNYLRYDAMALGNHEFDWGQEVLKKLIENSDFPNLSANVVYRNNPDQLFPGAKPYIIKEVNGVKIGIIGITDPDTPTVIMGKYIEGLLFLDAVETINKYLPLVRKEGAELVVLLSHCGLTLDKKIAEEVKGIDIIVGAHSHTDLHNPLKIGDTIIVQAGSRGRYVGKLELQLDPKTKKILTYTTENEIIPVLHKNIKPDPFIEGIVAKYNDKIKEKMTKVIARTEIDLVFVRPENYADTVLGNIICDALRYETEAEVALYNSGGIRAEIHKGDITVEKVINVLPFYNYVLTFDLPGSGIKRVLEQGAGEKSSTIQASGLTYSIDGSKPKGQRVWNVKVNGEPLDEKKLYKVSTVDFMFEGGDNFDFSGASKPVQSPLSSTVFAEYLTHLGVIKEVGMKRISLAKAGQECKGCRKKCGPAEGKKCSKPCGQCVSTEKKNCRSEKKCEKDSCVIKCRRIETEKRNVEVKCRCCR
jgi:5'-nucleotidase / UDP-sugar diphosphatase